MATTASRASPTIGNHLRDWRQRRRLSQLDLAGEANISARHLSFVETGRSMPSREMILHLAEQLQIPMRERNVLLVAAADPVLIELLGELAAYPGGNASLRHVPEPTAGVVVPFCITIARDELAFFSTTMIFGTPVDITLAELAVESFFPADAATVEIVQRITREE